jgi:hypothetical protein
MGHLRRSSLQYKKNGSWGRGTGSGLSSVNCVIVHSTKLGLRHSFTVRKHLSRLGSVVVTVLATGPKGSGFKASRGDGFLRAITIRMVSKAGDPMS